MDMKLEGYFDYASATPLDDSVFDVMKPFFATEFYNPSSLYSASDESKRAIHDARRIVANEIGVRSSEIVFTSGGTEANNLAIHGIMAANPGGKILISSIEHDSVRQAAQRYNCAEIPVDAGGVIDLSKLEQLVDGDVVLISVIYVNNEVGTIQPLRKIAEMIKTIRISRGQGGRPLYLHTDAAQAPNIRTITRSALGVDLMSLNGGKIYGPKGSGCLYIDSHVGIKPLVNGGGQERGLRSGTENTASIVGFATALQLACSRHSDEAKRLQKLRSKLEKEVIAQGGKLISINHDRSEAIVSIRIPGIDSETAVYKLDALGLYVSSGSACHAKSGVKSHALRAIGISDTDALSVIRISMGRSTTVRSIERLVDGLNQILA